MTEVSESTFVAVAVEHWRLTRTLQRLVDLLPESTKARVSAQARFASARLSELLSEAQVDFETFEGRLFDANLPVTAVNVGDFGPGAKLIVFETIEPTVLRGGKVLKLGKVSVAEGV